MNSKRFLLALALFLAPAFAGDLGFENGAPVTLKPDMGYILVRSSRDERALATINYSPILIRTLDPAEIEAATKIDSPHEANVVIPRADRPYARTETEITQIIPLKPGTYVLGGLANVLRSGWTEITVVTSLCMGTVAFEVKPGVITDLGTILNAAHVLPTAIPELANVVAGKDLDMNIALMDVAIRPPASDAPEALKALPIVPADYRAYGLFPNYLGGQFARLAPLPGVLDYDKDGNALDLKARTAKAE
jgi:hypothetical protein